jgi:predicted nucleic acid-binding protein
VQAASNSNPLIGLAKAEVFIHLNKLFDRLYIAPVVYRELCVDGQGRPGDSELRRALQDRWIEILTPSPSDVLKVGSSLENDDRQVVATALTAGVSFLLSDDQSVTRCSKIFNVTCLSTVDVLVLMKRQGLITVHKPVFTLLDSRLFKIHPSVVDQALRSVGE